MGVGRKTIIAPKFLVRFGFYNNSTTGHFMKPYMGATTTLIYKTSEGTTQRVSGYNGTTTYFTFSSANATKFVDVWVYSGSPTLTRIDGAFTQIGTTPGVVDLTMFPALVGQSVIYGGFNKVKINRATASVYLPSVYNFDTVTGLQVYYQTMDFTECLCASINHDRGGNSKITLPATCTFYTSLILFEHRIFNEDLLFGAYANCTLVSFEVGSVPAAGVNTVSLDGLTAVVTINGKYSGTRSITIGSNPFTALTTLNLERGRLSARAVAWGGGTFTPVATLLSRAVNLLTIQLGNNGFSESELSSLISAIHANLGIRPVSGTRTLDFAGQDANGYYPAVFNNGASGNIFGPNAPVVTNADRTKLQAIASAGWTVTYNRQVYMTASYIGSGSMTVTYDGNTNIDIWGGSTVVNVTTTDSSKVVAGQYTVTSGSGKTWVLTPNTGTVPLSSGATCLVTVDIP